MSCMFITACVLFDEVDENPLTIEESISSSNEITEISKATKIINALALQEILKNKTFAGNHFYSEPEAEVRSAACPNISPDPANYDPTVLTDYVLEFDRCSFSDQLIGIDGTPIVIGTVNISLQGRLGHSGCVFRVFGEDLSVGAIRYNEYDITQIHNRQITSDTCFKRDIIDFSTVIDALEFTVDGLEEFGETQNTMSVISASNGRTRYRDFKCDTDIAEFVTIIDDRIVIQADTIISGFEEDGSTFSRNIFTDVAAEFDLLCPCPISQSFNIIRGGTTALTCFDFDSEVCDDDLTCLTTTIELDCRF